MAAERLAADDRYLVARNLDYILTTADNWAGSIGTFHLTIVNSAPDHLVSLCLDGLEKTGPLTFELTLTDFVPTEDLKILFLERASYR